MSTLELGGVGVYLCLNGEWGRVSRERRPKMIGHVVSKQETPEEWGGFLSLWSERRESGLHRRFTRYYSREAQDAEELKVRRWINEDGPGGFLVGDVTVTGNPVIDAKTVIVNSRVSSRDDGWRLAVLPLCCCGRPPVP